MSSAGRNPGPGGRGRGPSWALRGTLRPLLCGALAGTWILGTMILTGCGGSGDPGATGGPTQGGALPTVRAERRDFSRSVPWFGRIESRHAVTVVAQAAGRVVAVEAADGSAVEAGRPLFRLGGPVAAARRATLEQKVHALEVRVQAADETVALRRDALAEQLVRRDELLAAEGEQARLGEELAAARQELDALDSALALRAPVGGTFTGRKVAVGQDVAAGEALAEIVDTASLRVVASVYFPSDASGTGTDSAGLVDAPVAFDDLPGGSGGAGGPAAKIVRVLPDRNAAGAVTVWIEGGPLQAPPEGKAGPPWGPGETVSGSVRLAVHQGAVAVPETAVARDAQDRPFVFVPASDSAGAGDPAAGSDSEEPESGYRKLAVTTGLSADGWVEVTSGLAAGTEVVSEGAYELLFRDFAATYKVPD